MPIKMTHKVVSEAVYVSLIGPFLGYYAKVPYARNNIEAGWICNQGKLKSLWCSTYTFEQVTDMIKEYGGDFLLVYPPGFDFDMYELEQLRAQIGNAEEVNSEL